MKKHLDKACEKARANGLIKFLGEQGVIGLAVGLVLGTATATLVNSLINNVVLPPVGLLLGSTDGLRGLVWEITSYRGDTVLIRYGAFLNDLVNFIIIVLVVYLVIRWLHIELKKKN
jgi:large conductance mechanosensitive channel